MKASLAAGVVLALSCGRVPVAPSSRAASPVVVLASEASRESPSGCVCTCDTFRLMNPPPAAPDDLQEPGDHLTILQLAAHDEYAIELERWVRLYAWPTCGPGSGSPWRP